MSEKAVSDVLQNAVNLNTVYPVGIVVWFAQNKNPNTLFPGTKWQYIDENKTISLAETSGSNVFTPGGSDLVTIGKGHLPVVPLKYLGTTVSSRGHTHTRGTMNITCEIGYIRSDNAIHSMATGAFSLANGELAIMVITQLAAINMYLTHLKHGQVKRLIVERVRIPIQVKRKTSVQERP
ncbi:hypothetical protein J4731_08150 [Providencia rettgeri]|nr:hypothetical protein [Providencia rettgeri]